MATITRIGVGRFKSIKDLQALELNAVNILIGANGSGKSNLISFFRLLHAIGEGRLQNFVATAGFADTLLYYGSKESPEMWGSVDFSAKTGPGLYFVRLAATATDSLVFSAEDVEYRTTKSSAPKRTHLGQGHKESLLLEGSHPFTEVWNVLSDPQIFHFHDTSDAAAIRKPGYIDDNRYLQNDGGNLAAFLYALNKRKPEYYRRVKDTMRQIAPFFDDFVLQPPRENENTIRLNWKDLDSEHLFGPHQLSDGTLRVMALVTLLLQPETELPSLIILDEPEIGLHPYAMEIVASLIRSAAVHTRLLIATQSVALVNHFSPEDVIVATRSDAQSRFDRLDSKDLEVWLKDYSVGDLWEKNLIGGTPSR
jgi:predicted ATPase